MQDISTLKRVRDRRQKGRDSRNVGKEMRRKWQGELEQHSRRGRDEEMNSERRSAGEKGGRAYGVTLLGVMIF